MRLKIDSLRAEDLVDRGVPIDVQDPALVIKIADDEFKTRRIKHAGCSAKFEEVFYTDIRNSSYESGELEVEVEVLNKGAFGKLSIHVGRGKINLKEAVPVLDSPVDFTIQLTHYSMIGRAPYEKGQIFMRGTLTKQDHFPLEEAQPDLAAVALEKLTDEHTEEMLKSIFGDIGELKEDVYCALSGRFLHTGRMYLTCRYICFYSKLFGREKKLRIPYDQISHISLETDAIGVQNYVAIKTGCGKTFKFWSFWDTEDAYFMIKGYQENFVETVKSRRASMSSKEPEPIDEMDDVTVASDIGPGDSGDWEAAFTSESEKARHKIEVIKGKTLPVTVAEFAQLFIDDSAEHNFKKYHESVKDKNVELSAWSGDISKQSRGFDRELKFFKPVNLPGLASTRGVKLQRLQRYEDHALLLCSSTRLEDVPAADTFSVDDTLVVRSVGDGSSVEVDISFEVIFVKSTFLKRMIEGPTNTEMKKWLDSYFQHLEKSCKAFKGTEGGGGAGAGASSKTSSTETSAAVAGVEGGAQEPDFVPEGYSHGEGRFKNIKLGKDKSLARVAPAMAERMDEVNAKSKTPVVKRFFNAAADLTASIGDMISATVEGVHGDAAAARAGGGTSAGEARGATTSVLPLVQVIVLVLILWVLWKIDAKMARMLTRLQKVAALLSKGGVDL